MKRAEKLFFTMGIKGTPKQSGLYLQYYKNKNKPEAQGLGFGKSHGRTSERRRLFLQKNRRREQYGVRGNVVGVGRFELPASWTRTMRATNCATPRNIPFYTA